MTTLYFRTSKRLWTFQSHHRLPENTALVAVIIIIFLQVYGHHPPPEATILLHHYKGGDCPNLGGCCLSGFPSVLLQRDEILLPQDRMYGGLARRLWRKTSIEVKKKKRKEKSGHNMFVRQKNQNLSGWPKMKNEIRVRWSQSVPLLLHSYQYALILLIYLLPLLVMLITYSIVGRSLWGGHIPGEATDHYHNQITAKRKVAYFYSALSEALFRFH